MLAVEQPAERSLTRARSRRPRQRPAQDGSRPVGSRSATTSSVSNPPPNLRGQRRPPARNVRRPEPTCAAHPRVDQRLPTQRGSSAAKPVEGEGRPITALRSTAGRRASAVAYGSTAGRGVSITRDRGQWPRICTARPSRVRATLGETRVNRPSTILVIVGRQRPRPGQIAERLRPAKTITTRRQPDVADTRTSVGACVAPAAGERPPNSGRSRRLYCH